MLEAARATLCRCWIHSHTHMHTHTFTHTYVQQIPRKSKLQIFVVVVVRSLRRVLSKPHLAHWADSPSPQTAGLLGCPGKLSLPGLLGGWAGWEGPSPGRGGALRARALQLPTSCPPLCWHCRASPLSPPKEGRGTRPYRRGLLAFTVFCWCTTN